MTIIIYLQHSTNVSLVTTKYKLTWSIPTFTACQKALRNPNANRRVNVKLQMNHTRWELLNEFSTDAIHRQQSTLHLENHLEIRSLFSFRFLLRRGGKLWVLLRASAYMHYYHLPHSSSITELSLVEPNPLISLFFVHYYNYYFNSISFKFYFYKIPLFFFGNL